MGLNPLYLVGVTSFDSGGHFHARHPLPFPKGEVCYLISGNPSTPTRCIMGVVVFLRRTAGSEPLEARMRRERKKERGGDDGGAEAR